jgi:hypothetical protein
MSAKSDFLENKLIDHIFRDTAYSKPTAIKVHLYTAAPGETGGGTEVSGGNYAAVTVGPSVATWKSTNGTTSGASSGTGGQTMNASAVTFGVPSANWGSVTHMAIKDESANSLYYGALTTSKTVNNGDPAPSFAADALTVTEA